MRIYCPKCKVGYEIDENLIPEEGKKLHCSYCHETFVAHKEDLIATPVLPKIESEKTEENVEDTNIENEKGSDMLPFDFYIYDKNIIIEYDGLHHFEPIKGWGGEEKFKTTQKNDKIKNTYCKNKGITLIRIPYTYTKEEIIQVINNFVSPATITV